MENMQIIKRFIALFLIISFALILPAKAQVPVKLSGALSERLSETSFNRDGIFQIAPDGSKVVYVGTTGSGGSLRQSLYVINVDGTGARKLLDIATIARFKVTPDSKYAVARTFNGLYSVSLLSGDMVRLDIDGDQTEIFEISPDSNMVVYTDAARAKLFSNAITGGQRTRLDVVSYERLDLNGYKITQDSARVVFMLLEPQPSGIGKPHIVSTPIAGGPTTELLPDDTLDVASWQLSSDGQYLVYQLFNPDVNLYSIPVVGGSRTQLSIPLIDVEGSIFEQGVQRYLISPNGTRVVYSFKPSTSNDNVDVYAVDVTGGSSQKLIIADGLLNKFCGTVFSLTSSQLVYCLQGSDDSEFFLYSTNYFDVQVPISLNGSIPIPNVANSRQYSADASALLLSALENVGDNYQQKLSYIPLNGSASSTVFDFTSTNLGCFNPAPFFLAEELLTYCADFNGDGNYSLYVDKISGGEPRKLLNNMNGSLRPAFFALNSSGEKLVYVTTSPTGDSGSFTTDLFSISTEDDDEMCFPIKSGPTKVAVICI